MAEQNAEYEAALAADRALEEYDFVFFLISI